MSSVRAYACWQACQFEEGGSLVDLMTREPDAAIYAEMRRRLGAMDLMDNC